MPKATLKSLVKSCFRLAGMEVRKLQPEVIQQSPDAICAASVKESQHYKQWSMPFPLFAPWEGHPEFEPYYMGIEPFTLVSRDRCYVLAKFARHAVNIDGDFAECGVFKGGTALLLCRVLADTKKSIFLFDSFEGLAQEDPDHDNYYKKGDFAHQDVSSVERLLNGYKDTYLVKKGWIPESFSGLEDKTFAFVHVDVDMYQAALDCCKFFYTRLMPGGVMIFDEYGFPSCRGEKDAVDQFCEDKRDKPIALPTGQALLLKSV